MNQTKGLNWTDLMSGENSRDTRNNSKAMLLGLYLSFLLLLVYIGLFLILRHRIPGLYCPKTYLGLPCERNDPPPKDMLPFKLLRTMFQTPDYQVIRSCGLDAFFFLRYIQFMLGLFAVLTGLVIPTLVPVNIVGARLSTRATTSESIISRKPDNETLTPANQDSIMDRVTDLNVTSYLDLLSWGNLDSEHYNWYWVHFVVAVTLIVIVCYALFIELKYFVQIRQDCLRTHNRQDIWSNGTILVAAIPQHRLNVEDLTRYYAGFYGGVEHVWINKDTHELNEKIHERARIIKLLEKVETKLVSKATKEAWKKLDFQREPTARIITEGVAEERPIHSNDARQETTLQIQNAAMIPEIAAGDSDSSEQLCISERELTNSPCSGVLGETVQEHANERWRLWLNEKDRPTVRISHHRTWFLKNIPFLSRKEDAIVYYRHEISRLNGEIEAMRKRELPYLDSAFIRFKTRSGAYFAFAAPRHPATMRVIAFEPSFDDIIWPNISPSCFSLKVNRSINFSLVAVVILLYCIPSAIAGGLSQLSTILRIWEKRENGGKTPEHSEFLLLQHMRICSLIQMVCPSVILMLFRLLTSSSLYYFATMQGAPTKAHIELVVQDGLFAFLYVQIFIVGPISANSIKSVALSAVNQVTNHADGLINTSEVAKEIPKILAHELPNSTIFLLGFLMFQGVSTGGDEIGQVCSIFFELWHQLRTALGKTRTPRQIYKYQRFVPQCTLGVRFPLITLYACIVLALCTIQPAVLLFGTVGFLFLWIGFGYSFLYVKRVAGSVAGTNGEHFIKAINHTFGGIYVMELCLVGLFASVGTDNRNDYDGTEDGGCKAVVQGALMSVVFFSTIGWHWYVNRWLTQVGMGLHSSKDREYEDMDLEAFPGERPVGLNQSTKKETVPIVGKGKRKGPESGRKLPVVRRIMKKPSKAGQRERCNYNEADESGEGDYLPKALWEDQRSVWIPDDGDLVGVGRDEVRLCKAAGVMAQVEGEEIEIGKARKGEESITTAVQTCLDFIFTLLSPDKLVS